MPTFAEISRIDMRDNQQYKAISQQLQKTFQIQSPLSATINDVGILYTKIVGLGDENYVSGARYNISSSEISFSDVKNGCTKVILELKKWNETGTQLEVKKTMDITDLTGVYCILPPANGNGFRISAKTDAGSADINYKLEYTKAMI